VAVFVFDHFPPALALFMESEAGASMYEYALVAALTTVVVIIVLIAVAISA
jgi:Flp pilus assembly pilin Flp